MRLLILQKNQHFFRQINGFIKDLISRKIFGRDRVLQCSKVYNSTYIGLSKKILRGMAWQ